MFKKPHQTTDPGLPILYQIRIEGHLGLQWTDWFEGLMITLEDDGNTLLSGPVVDQAALYGLLKKIRDLGTPLVSVTRVQPPNRHPSYSKKGVIKMNSINKISGMEDMKVKLQTLWIFVMFNYLYADVLGLHDSAVLKEILTGQVGSLQISEGFLLVAAILMETAIAMVLLSRILPYRANRWANIIVAVIHTAAVLSSMFVGTPIIYYIFFGTIEIACTLFIVWSAWRWTNPEGQP